MNASSACWHRPH